MRKAIEVVSPAVFALVLGLAPVVCAEENGTDGNKAQDLAIKQKVQKALATLPEYPNMDLPAVQIMGVKNGEVNLFINCANLAISLERMSPMQGENEGEKCKAYLEMAILKIREIEGVRNVQWRH